MDTLDQESDMCSAPWSYERALAGATLEINPGEESALEKTPSLFRMGGSVHITMLPGGTLSNSLPIVRSLARAGYKPVPHVAVRRVETLFELSRFLYAIRKAGAESVFLIAGDTPRPRGPFASSVEVLRTGVVEGEGIGHVGIAGYPEGHPLIADAEIEHTLIEKLSEIRQRGMDPWIVSQFCFDAAVIATWLSGLAAQGVDCAVRVGFAGPTEIKTLLRYARLCGIGASIRAIRSQGGRLRKLARYGGPEAMLRELIALLTPDDQRRFDGIHVYPFGGLSASSAWLHGADD